MEVARTSETPKQTWKKYVWTSKDFVVDKSQNPATIGNNNFITRDAPNHQTETTFVSVKVATDASTVDVDAMVKEIENTTEMTTNKEQAAFGGLDMHGMMGSFFGGMYQPN